MPMLHLNYILPHPNSVARMTECSLPALIYRYQWKTGAAKNDIHPLIQPAEYGTAG